MHLVLVAAGVAPFGQRRRVAHLRGLVVALHHRQLGVIQPGGGLPDPAARYRQEQVTHRGLVADPADELPHDAQAAAGADASPTAA